MKILSKMTEGLYDETYMVENKGELAVLKKFNRKDPLFFERFQRERYLLDIFSLSGLAPQIIKHDENEAEILMRYFKHRNMYDIRQIIDDTDRIVEAMSAIHNHNIAEIPGFFKLSSSFSGKGRASSVRRTFSDLNLTSRYKKMQEELIEFVSEEHEKGIASLLHGDLHYFNTLVGLEGEVRFIDFGKARLGDPAYDKASYMYRIANGQYVRSKRKDVEKIFQIIISRNARPDEEKRIRTYYYMIMFNDMPWLMNEWEIYCPEKKGKGKKIAEDNLIRLEEAYKNKFQEVI